MTLPVLTHARIAESAITIAGTNPTATEFLAKIKAMVDASANWQTDTYTPDDGSGNTRGYYCFKPKSTDPLVKDQRFIFCYASAATSTFPSTRMTGWAAPASANGRMWFGISNNAGTSTLTNPYSGAPYAAAGINFSGFVSINTTLITAGQVFGMIESEETFSIYWTTAANVIASVIAGRIREDSFGNVAYTGMLVQLGSSPASGVGVPWGAATTSEGNAYWLGLPIWQVSSSAIYVARGWWMDSLGTLYGMGRGQWSVISANATAECYTDGAEYVFAPIVTSGGLYVGGVSQAFGGVLRQMRWGPYATRQGKYTYSGVDRAYHLTYHASVSSQGVWFVNSRA